MVLVRSLVAISFCVVFAALSSERSCEIAPGIELKIIKRTGLQAQMVYVVTIDTTRRQVKLEHAMGGGCCREPVSSIVERVGALLGINGDNYRRGGAFNGNTVDLLKIKEQFYSQPGIFRSALCWDEKECKPLIGPVHWQVELAIGEKTYKVDRINQPRAQNECILYTSAFGPSTRTTSKGCEIVVDHGKVVHIAQSKGNAEIPVEGFVYSIGAEAAQRDLLKLKIEAAASYIVSITMEAEGKQRDISAMDYIISGAGILISHATCLSDFETDFKKDEPIMHFADEIAADFSIKKERERLIFERHPRTAVGVLPDGTWLFVVVDGRQDGYSTGISLPDLANLMVDLGCIDALNMGGGGCTTLYAQGILINSPCGDGATSGLFFQEDKLRRERPVASAFVVF